MSGGQQLERSVLEAKEREELQAIADALGLKASSRAKKADLVDQILRATGVETGTGTAEPEEKPKRTRARKAAAPPADAATRDAAAGEASAVTDAPTLPLDDAPEASRNGQAGGTDAARPGDEAAATGQNAGVESDPPTDPTSAGERD